MFYETQRLSDLYQLSRKVPICLDGVTPSIFQYLFKLPYMERKAPFTLGLCEHRAHKDTFTGILRGLIQAGPDWP